MVGTRGESIEKKYHVGREKKALCMARDTLHDNIISLVFLSISCKVADSPPPSSSLCFFAKPLVEFFTDFFHRGRSPSPAHHDDYEEQEHNTHTTDRLLERGKSPYLRLGLNEFL